MAKTAEETRRDEELQALAELHRSGATMFQDAIGQLTQVAASIVALAKPDDTRTLDERMAAVQLELENVERRGHAEVETRSGGKYTYDYILEADLMKAIRPLLSKHGIATYYSDRIVSIDQGQARVEVVLRLRAAGEELELRGEGVANDTGDKHANKAKTAAMRYLLWKTFLQPSDEDPEQTNVSAAEARGAHEGREAAAERRSSTAATRRPRAGQQTPEERKGRAIQRLGTLANELDEIQGKTPGATLGKLHEDIQLQYGVAVHDLQEPELVEVGQALARHVAGQREIAERDGEAVELFELPPVAA